jgi:hypothetical protein
LIPLGYSSVDVAGRRPGSWIVEWTGSQSTFVEILPGPRGHNCMRRHPTLHDPRLAGFTLVTSSYRAGDQMEVPDVDMIDGLPPAVALQQQRGTPTTRSSVGSVTTLSNLLRMLYSRAGDYPPRQGILYAESFSPNTPE